MAGSRPAADDEEDGSAKSSKWRTRALRGAGSV